MAEKIKFFDVKTKKFFETPDYEIRVKNGRAFVVAKSPNGPHECWKVIGKDKKDELKKAGVRVKEIA